MTERVSGRRVRYPLLAMWIWPQATIRDVITRSNPLPPVLLSALAGIYAVTALITFLAPGVGAVLPLALIIGIGGLAGVACLYLCGALFWLAGNGATQREIRRALGWLAIPYGLTINLIAVLWLLGSGIATMMSPSSPLTDSRQNALAAAMLLAAPLGLWGFVISVRGLAAVLQTGFLRTLASLVLVSGGMGVAAASLAGHMNSARPSLVVPDSVMFPTLGALERHLLRPPADLARGDIVAYQRLQYHPHYGMVSRLYIKRVIGLPGDVVAMNRGVLSVNGESVRRERLPDLPLRLAASRAQLHFQETMPSGVTYGVVDADENRTLGIVSHQVGPDQLFLLGDNRDDDVTQEITDTYQGRAKPTHHGLVWRDRVIGEVVR